MHRLKKRDRVSRPLRPSPFVPPLNKSRIEEGKIRPVLESINSDLTSLVAENYELIAREILRMNEDKIFSFDTIGRWWDRNEEIDVVALNEKESKILFGEVKWSIRPVGIDIMEDLKRKARCVEWKKEERQEYYCLFSRSGFTEALIKRARKANDASELSRSRESVFLFEKDGLIEL